MRVEAIVQPGEIARPVYAPVFFSVLRTCVGKSRAPSKGAILKRCQEPTARGRIGSLGNRDIPSRNLKQGKQVFADGLTKWARELFRQDQMYSVHIRKEVAQPVRRILP